MGRPCWGTVALAVCLAAAVLAPARAALKYDSNTDAYGGTLLTPTKGTLDKRDFYFEIPHDPVGVLFMAHGCVHDAADFWPSSAACPECSGLPEEVSHTKQALARGYAVIAVDSKDRRWDSRCYSYDKDKWGVKAILESWLVAQNLTTLPVFALGVSAGASFALKLPKVTRINGVISEVLGVPEEGFGTAVDLGDTYPPTVFVDMLRDSKMTARIAESVALLRSVNVSVARIPVDPRPVAPTFFSDRSEAITPELSIRLVAGLRKIGMLDAQGYVTADPRYTTQPWKQQLAQLVPELSLETKKHEGPAAKAAIIGEQMNLAFAQHEIISDHLTACLAWLEAQGQVPIERFELALQIKSRLVDLQARRQDAPPLLSDAAQEAASKQVLQQLAITLPTERQSWGQMYAAYVEWLEAYPQFPITFPQWQSLGSAGMRPMRDRQNATAAAQASAAQPNATPAAQPAAAQQNATAVALPAATVQPVAAKQPAAAAKPAAQTQQPAAVQAGAVQAAPAALAKTASAAATGGAGANGAAAGSAGTSASAAAVNKAAGVAATGKVAAASVAASPSPRASPSPSPSPSPAAPDSMAAAVAANQAAADAAAAEHQRQVEAAAAEAAAFQAEAARQQAEAVAQLQAEAKRLEQVAAQQAQQAAAGAMSA